METRGRDVTPEIIEKIRTLKDDVGVKILQRILEGGQHVAIGLKRLYQQCHEQALEPEVTFKKLILMYFKNNKTKDPLNTEIRLKAGFTANELA